MMGSISKKFDDNRFCPDSAVPYSELDLFPCSEAERDQSADEQ